MEGKEDRKNRRIDTKEKINRRKGKNRPGMKMMQSEKSDREKNGCVEKRI